MEKNNKQGVEKKKLKPKKKFSMSVSPKAVSSNSEKKIKIIRKRKNSEESQNATNLPKKVKQETTKFMRKSMKQKKKSELELMTSKPELTKFVAKTEDQEEIDDPTMTAKVSTLKTLIQDSPEKLERTLFVGNIPVSMNIKEVKQVFKPFGKIESIRFRAVVPKKMSIPKKVANIKREYNAKTSSLKGFVVFKTVEAANEALKLNGTVVNNHHLRVDKANAQKQTGSGSCSIFVGNLPFAVEDETLWTTFAEYGDVTSVRIVRDNSTGVGKGFGFVQYEDEDSVKKALSQVDLQINGRPIRVQRCGNKKSKTPKKEKKTTTGEKDHSPQRKFFSKKKGQDKSGSRKTFKKMMNKRKMEQNKKKIASILKV